MNDHIRLRSDEVYEDSETLILFCIHCSEEFRIKLPISLNLLSGILKGFSKDHASCTK